MLCVELRKYNKECKATIGGVSYIWNFDPEDVDWTYTPNEGYKAVTSRDVALVPKPFVPSQVERETAYVKFTQTKTGSNISYAYEVGYQLADCSEVLSDYLVALDTASICCGIGYVFYLNSGKILVVGEKYVNGELIPEFYLEHNGTEGNTGTKKEDFNGATVKVTGTYSRPPREFTESIVVIQDLSI